MPPSQELAAPGQIPISGRAVGLRVLVIGAGAREHALSWKLLRSPQVDALYVVPGNGGTASIASNLPVSAEDMEGLLRAARDLQIGLTVVGPEAPMALGIVDRFRACGLPIFGPTREASRLEWSKSFARELMKAHNVPGPDFNVFHHLSEATSFLEKHSGPVVVKADGLAAGKGSIICSNRAEALAAVRLCMEERAFGQAGSTVVVEECLEGTEISVFAFCDGKHVAGLMAACDYKRAGDGDQGPNTGGMGSYAPPINWTSHLQKTVMDSVLSPVVRAMAERGTPFQGVLYAGLMLTQEGPRVLEFNCRLGDPEAQVLLPLLETDLVDVLQGCLESRVHQVDFRWAPGACVGVVMASPGYPGEYQKGLPICGLERIIEEDVLVFHAGTRVTEEGLATDGGRVLTVAARGESLAHARERAYYGLGKIHFQGAHYRHDIALLGPRE